MMKSALPQAGKAIGAGDMTPRESFIRALNRQPAQGLVPHFELEFFLTMEAFGRVHPSQRHYRQWGHMSETERQLHRQDVADLHVTVARQYGQSGMLFNRPGGWQQDDVRLCFEHIRALSGMDYLLTMHGDATYSLPDGNTMMEFVMRMADEPGKLKDEAKRNVERALVHAQQLKTWGTVDGFCLCSDYCFNTNPFFSPAQFEDFVAPYLKELIAGYRDLGFYAIKHTDGNIMPILDALLDANPHALHSLDPQGGVSLAEMKRVAGDRVCLIGNVNCGLLQNGTDEEIDADIRRALNDGMPGGGYVFGTSNCIYTGLPLARYQRMLAIRNEVGWYD